MEADFKGGTIMNQIKRRPNPFDTQEPVQKTAETPFINPTPQFETRKITPEPTRVIQTQPGNVENREKYTSTMDSTLRKKIKIACAMKGIMFAQFIEEACIEKLKREGMM